jgi:ferritin-like metal-binding protein YciE
MKTTTSGRQRSTNSRTNNENVPMDNPLHKAFLDELADLYDAEHQLIKALPKMAKAAQSDELREAFESHLQETEGHARRIEQAVRALGETPRRKRCKAMDGLIAEGKELMEEYEDNPALDAVLISAAQKVEHYEIASYGTVCAWAEQMNHPTALEKLRANLDEEKAADEKLTAIAEGVANPQAE